MSIVHEFARAKVNLTLRICGRRPDGYHELESLVAFASIADLLTVDSGGPAGLVLSGTRAPALLGANIVIEALELLQRSAPDLCLGRVALEKRLPVAAGLGGGSADAAAVFRAIRRLNPLIEQKIDWAGLALRLGADVPVCLGATSAIIRGVGERLTPCRVPTFAAVLVNPCAAVPIDKTRRVFKALASTPTAPLDHAPAMPISHPCDLADLLALMRHYGNDLERPALSVVPAIAVVKAALVATPGCRHVQLSGAGPTCFGVFSSLSEALQAERALAASEPSWWVCATMIGDAPTDDRGGADVDV